MKTYRLDAHIYGWILVENALPLLGNRAHQWLQNFGVRGNPGGLRNEINAVVVRFRIQLVGLIDKHFKHAFTGYDNLGVISSRVLGTVSEISVTFSALGGLSGLGLAFADYHHYWGGRQSQCPLGGAASVPLISSGGPIVIAVEL